ncbi:MFS general substrate transporter [Coccomyxa subellipsoidea C-169]|uniref:MFS general substrate transporter n=1 Tax=Coccomyxa subellipsoidea (strain C-169) TaxID=574566 RepID=I0YM72_COCSC|nr:MFS general substrate transporter [Coccomyxa subellipsoidea C-169]EIE19491.1 MFS general substrate transporter [Coccomyxa subellipsoidea C-169]|eukprot:XP_005644035.1 MFS general substrate transporter [Coccomyxa subellipsoidea C-169]
MLQDGRDELTTESHAKRTLDKQDEFNSLRITIICLGEVLEGIHITMPYTMAAYMVRDFLRGGNTDAQVDEETVGRLTGILASVFCGAQFLTSYSWGVFSDKYGRKCVLLMSIISGCISAIIFGLSGNYAMACSARLFGGIFNATGGTVKAMLADSCTNRTLPRALGYLGLAWGLGSMLGPMIGGALSYPCSIFPSSALCQGNDALFQRRPFLLPCLFAATMGLITAMLSSCILEETLPTLRRKPKQRGDVEMAQIGGDVEEARKLLSKGAERMRRPSARSFLDYQDEEGSDSDASLVLEGAEEDGAVLTLTAVPPSPRPIIVPSPLPGGSTASTPRYTAVRREEDPELGSAQALADITNKRSSADASSKDGSREGHGEWQQDAASRLSADERRWGEDQGLLSSSQASAAPAERPWYHDRQVLLALASYGVVAFLFNLLDEVRPIFASAPIRDGGLGMSTHLLSWPLSFGGLSFILFVCLGYDRFYKAVGGVWCTRWGMVLIIPTALFVPLATLFAHNKVAVMAQLFLAMAVNSIADTSAYSGSNVIINAAAPPGVAGAVNGAGQAVSALMRAFGPFLGGLAWSLSIHVGFPGHQFLVFAAVSLIAFLYQFTYAWVDLPNLDK